MYCPVSLCLESPSSIPYHSHFLFFIFTSTSPHLVQNIPFWISFPTVPAVVATMRYTSLPSLPNTEVIFIHNDQLYEQTRGLAMGVADSPDLANLYGWWFE